MVAYVIPDGPPVFINQNSSAGGLGPYPVTGLNGTLGTVSTQVIGQQPNRTAILFFNPNPIATVAFCPAVDGAGNPLAAVINGGGSYTLEPLGQMQIVGSCGCAWNAIASQVSSSLTVWAST